MTDPAAILEAHDALRPDYQRIARELRRQIGEGLFPPGTRLPSTEQLAKKWRSNVFTVHTALAALAREGWIDRVRGAGTFVAESKQRFACAAIYHESDIGSSNRSDFVRIVNDCLLDRLHALKKETRVFTDTRPMDKRDSVLPALADAIQGREVQCVIAPTTTFNESPALKKIALPIAFAGNPGSVHRVDFDKEEFVREGARALAARGCRSVGMIAPNPAHPIVKTELLYDFGAKLREVAQEEGLATRPAWISKPMPPRSDADAFGYREFRRIWKLPQRPDGLLVFPDSLSRGVITSVLSLGAENVTHAMKFVLHRNAHIGLLCPFPVTWGISDEELLARSLIRIIEKQFRGEPVTPTLLPYAMKFDDGARWK